MKNILILLAVALAAVTFTLALDSVLPSPPRWEILCDDATATVYHAVPAQCNADVVHTASMFTIDTSRAGEYRILAMERTMMTQYGISYGDVVRVEGAEAMDGLWRVEDTMNRRYANQHKIDFLVNTDIRTGKWTNVRVYRKVNVRPYHARRTTI